MGKLILVLAVFVVSCAGDPPAEPLFCIHDIECAEYPTWQTEYTFTEGYSNYECEPCWFSEKYNQRGECCACNAETHHHWCDEDGTGMYHCAPRSVDSPLGHLEHYSCATDCLRRFGDSAWYTADDSCWDAYPGDGEAECDCGEWGN
jgi:hypothetical protein